LGKRDGLSTSLAGDTAGSGESVRSFRIILGLCTDLVLFGALVPWAAVRAGHIFDSVFPVPLNLNAPLFDIVGIIAIALGAAWLFWAWYLLVMRGHGYMTELFGIEISPVTEHLVTGGPFSVHRHPVCVGYLLILAGIGTVIGSPGLIALGVPLLLALVYLYLRLFEEPALRRRFGPDYEAYAERVPLFFPNCRNRVPVASRNLRADRVRFAVNVIGVAFAVLLICFQLSILKGTRVQITTYIDHAGADIWVMQKGVDDFIATSSVPRESVDTLERLDGVRKAAGIYAIYTLLEINHVKSRVYVIGYDTVSGDGGPWKLGKTLPHISDPHSLRPDEVLLDENLARRHGLDPGDRVSLFGHSFTVAGFTLETTSIGSQYAFLPRETIGRILPGGPFSFTHVLVWSDGTAPGRDLVRRIGEATGLSSLTRNALAANMREFLGMFMLPLLTAGVVMGFLVGSVTIGITLYTAVLERIKEYGTLKALGATDWFLFGVLLRQSFISLAIGTVTGLILGAFANHLINQWVPGMTAVLDGAIMIETTLAGLVMAALSTGLPMWRLLRLDPMEVFRS
jgi:putative ABC transport system permease protein